jgi:hypothetical protein
VVARHSIAANGRKSTVVLEYYLVKTKVGLKIDWSANAGYNPVAFKAWVAGTDKSLMLRTEAKLSDYFNYHYREAKGTHYSISLKDNYGKRFDSFHGNAAKDSDVGRKLFEILKDGHTHRLTVTVERTGRETSVVGIKELVSESWVK